MVVGLGLGLGKRLTSVKVDVCGRPCMCRLGALGGVTVAPHLNLDVLQRCPVVRLEQHVEDVGLLRPCARGRGSGGWQFQASNGTWIVNQKPRPTTPAARAAHAVECGSDVAIQGNHSRGRSRGDSSEVSNNEAEEREQRRHEKPEARLGPLLPICACHCVS